MGFSGWGRRCELVIQSSKVTQDCTDFPVLIHEDSLPSEIFDADGSYPALNGGGDLRFSSDEAGDSQLPCEVESFVTDNDPANGKSAVWVKRTLSSASNTSIWVYYNKSGETQPAEDNAYGKENVWDSNFAMVQHMNQDPSGGAGCIVDSTSNDNDGTPSGMDSADQVAGQIDGSLEFDGVDDYVDAGGVVHDADNDLITITAWIKTDITTLSEMIVGARGVGGSGNVGYSFRFAGNSPNDPLLFSIFGVIDQLSSASGISAGELVNIGVTYNKQNIIFYKNGNVLSSHAQTSAIFPSTNNLFIGAYNRYGVAAEFFNGIIDEVRISNVARSAGWIATEYNNQYEPSTFLIEGTPETPSAGTLRELSTTIAATTVLSSSSADILRELTATSAAQTTTSASELLILRELSAAIASTTTTPSIGADILREIASAVAASTITATPGLNVLRELAAAIASETTTSDANANILRELTSAIAAVTTLSEIELLIGTLRELAATIAVTTSTSASELAILRELTATLAPQTTSTASLSILRELTATVAAGTSLSEIELLIGALRELTTTIAVSTTTSSPAFNVLREITSAIGAATTSSTPSMSVLRGLTSTIAATTTLSEIDLLIGTLRELSTTIAATTTSAGALIVLRETSATIATQTDSAATLSVLRALQTSIASGTTLSEIELLIGVLRELATTIAATTTTSAASLSILRELLATIAATTTLSEIELILGTLRELSATIAATTTTATPELLVLRELTSTMAVQTDSAASMKILRELTAIVAAGTTLSEIELLIGELRELSATIATTTTTSDVTLNVIRAFTSTIGVTTSTSDISILMVRALSAQIAAGTETSAATMLVLREFSATIDAVTLTSAITLLVSAAGLIIDTEIQSLTPDRTLSSLTAIREIQEM